MGRLTRDGKRVPLVRVSGRWLEAFGFKEGAKFTAIGVEGGLRVLTVYEAAPNGRTSLPDASRAIDAQDDAVPRAILSDLLALPRPPVRAMLNRRTSHPRLGRARAPRSLLSASRRVFCVEHSRRNAKHFAVLVAGLRKILLAKLATLRVTLRVCNFLNDLLKHETPRSRGA
jgi:hypothetical protein